jgi:ABC-type Zn uptake system ZnuABC Zn-binding protein ZnuA
VAKVEALDRSIRRRIDALPESRRTLVTNHDAFGYYVRRYGLRFVGSIIPSFDSSAELSGADLADLVARIRATGVTAIFSEASLPPKTAETVGREAGVTVVGGEDALYGDTLGPAGSDGDTYLKAEEHNTATIVGALGG